MSKPPAAPLDPAPIESFHRVTCGYWPDGNWQERPCSCGLNAALATERQQHAKEKRDFLQAMVTINEMIEEKDYNNLLGSTTKEVLGLRAENARLTEERADFYQQYRQESDVQSKAAIMRAEAAEASRDALQQQIAALQQDAVRRESIIRQNRGQIERLQSTIVELQNGASELPH